MISRRSLLVLSASTLLAGCSLGLVGRRIRRSAAQLYCNHISCKNGEAKLSELSELVYWRVVNAAKQAKEAGLVIRKSDIDKRYENELQIAKQSLRDSGIRLVNDL